jgi:tRNA threonylcarbamoyl adenosine modification protein YjeE
VIAIGTSVVEVASEEETLQLARELALELRGGDVVHLLGDLGTGKTRFAKGLAAGLGLDPDAVRSPTFAFVDVHAARGGLGFVHVDLYRVGDASELAELGLQELPGPDAVAAIEWAERLPPGSPRRAVVRLQDLGGDRRRVEVTLGR